MDVAIARPTDDAVVARRARGAGWYPAAVGVVVLSGLLGIMIGPAGPTWWRVPLAVLDHLPLISIDSGVSDPQWNIVWQVRMPRVVLAGIVGSMLSLAGASYQGVFRNPLVDPYLLGAAAGAGLGATIVFTVARSSTADWPVDPAPAMAFVFALATVAVTYVVGAAFGGTKSSVTLVLAGVAMVSLTTAIQTFLLQRHSEVVREVYSWILGRLSSASWADVRMVLPYVVGSSIVLLLHRRHLDLLRIGDDEAATLGAPVARVRLVVVVAATLGTAAVVAAHGAPDRRLQLPAVAAAHDRLRRRVPDPRRYPWTRADRPGRDPDRCGHRVPGGAVLHPPAPHPAGRSMSERSELDVTGRCSPRSGARLVAAPCVERSWTLSDDRSTQQ
jgi:iron complex transport system permease protein